MLQWLCDKCGEWELEEKPPALEAVKKRNCYANVKLVSAVKVSCLKYFFDID